ncbi:helix-turn-helix transcriptional regulator [Paraburkholderia phenazinium]|uniref:Predicted DNA-binding transcriptional regulator AlpA n=1 Tax=Paraburkholderia phenazinium TaxID=60549 RepID=A0A1G7W7I9_9BURK|nr:AlpA family phage regulatory protein [Paraburkholderia phenazinium]SDG67916.1 Predicted DNA-binding transcriptional regulator AlpA [Paraburkholderia phenazinium]
MTQTTLPATGAAANPKQPLSPIAQIRCRQQPLPANTGGSSHACVLPDSAATTRTTASAASSANAPLLDQLIARVRACVRDRYLKEQEVLAIACRSKAAVRRDVSLGRFPSPVKTGIKSSRWRESEVMAWVEATTILSRVANPGFSMEEFVSAMSAPAI